MINEIKKYKLKNGTRVVLVPDKSAVATIAQVLVNVGSDYESKSNNGVSHFLEHMIFKGTKTRPSTKIIAEEVENVGGSMNAWTGEEETGYWVKLPSEYTEQAIDIVGDICLNPLLDQEEINKEREVILQEIAMYEDLPMRKVEEDFSELLYGDQPAGCKIIGRVENIQKMKRKTMKDYWEKKYTPQSTVVIIAGNFSEDKVKKQIENLFGAKKKTRKAIKRKTTEKQNKPQIKFTEKDTDQTHLVLGFRAFNMFDERRYALFLLTIILGGGMSSRLFLQIREKQGLAYYINVDDNLSTDRGNFVVQAGVAHQNLQKTINLILQEIKKITNKKISQKELQKVKEKMKGGLKMSLETVQSKAGFYGHQELYHRKIYSPEEILNNYEKITAEDIQRVAQDVFKNNRLNLAVVGQKQKKELEFKL